MNDKLTVVLAYLLDAGLSHYLSRTMGRERHTLRFGLFALWG